MNPKHDGFYTVINWADQCVVAKWQKGKWWIKTPLGYEMCIIKQWREKKTEKWNDVTNELA